MKRYQFMFIALTCFITLKLGAQNREDAVYLKNGSIYRGKVTENIPGIKTTIQTSERNVFVVADTAIKMVLFNQEIPAQNGVSEASPVEMAASVNFYGGSKNTAGFTFITSYHFPVRLTTGFGIGIEWFDHQQLPFIADIRYYFLQGTWSPCIYAMGGYAVPLSKKDENNSYTDFYGGPLTGIGAGMLFEFNKRNALVFNLGYRYQKTKTVNEYSYYYGTNEAYETISYNTYNRITFSFGFIFY